MPRFLPVGLAAGAYHTCTLLVGGSIYCWGYNGYGQLGTGDTSSRLSPTAVALLGAGEFLVKLRRGIQKLGCGRMRVLHSNSHTPAAIHLPGSNNAAPTLYIETITCAHSSVDTNVEMKTHQVRYRLPGTETTTKGQTCQHNTTNKYVLACLCVHAPTES